VSWLSTGVRVSPSGIRRDVSDDNAEDEDEDDEDDEVVDESAVAAPRARSVSSKSSPGATAFGRAEEESCIGIRRRCLLD